MTPLQLTQLLRVTRCAPPPQPQRKVSLSFDARCAVAAQQLLVLLPPALRRGCVLPRRLPSMLRWLLIAPTCTQQVHELTSQLVPAVILRLI